MEQIDLVVIGAGFHGLIAAKTYLDVHPSTKVILYDSASSVGGCWAKENLYPGLRTNNMLGTYEFSDYPMDSETYGVKAGEYIPGEVVRRYLTNFAEHFGIYKRIRLNTRVESKIYSDS
ncbi:FAD/NAD(P)-binding domain-containing protein [Cadophora sp. DSE1049]|nr:FAD/NAD(P)-binding domain-containing protein [Cadophora sp. DSE1049]